jgi:hypothetical protein
MSETISFDLKRIFECCACKDDKSVKGPFTRAPKKDYYQKHPPIGQGGELFFVNINPRSTQNVPMGWAMESLEHFQQFSRNRYKETYYIPSCENFYDIHYRISKAIFPVRSFEEVAIVHELYLCATPSRTGGLSWRSPCAERYMWQHLLKVRPKLVVAFGDLVEKFFCSKAPELTNANVRVISLPFRVIRWSEERKTPVIDFVKRCFGAVATGDSFPTFDFEDGAHCQWGDLWRRIDTVNKTVTLTPDHESALAHALRNKPVKKTTIYNGVVAAIRANDGAINSAMLTLTRRRGGMGFSANYLAWMAQEGVVALDGATGRDSPIRS